MKTTKSKPLNLRIPTKLYSALEDISKANPGENYGNVSHFVRVAIERLVRVERALSKIRRKKSN